MATDRFYRGVQVTGRLLAKLLFRVEITGAGRVPSVGAVILASNHASDLDAGLVAAASPRQLKFLAKAELFRKPWLARLVGRLGAVAVERGTADLGAIRSMLSLLGDGHAVLVFPEGTLNDGTALLPPMPGVAMLARQSGAPVVPVALVGIMRVWPRCKRWPRPRKLIVAFGEPIVFSEATAGLSDRDARTAFGKLVMQRIGELMAAHGVPVTHLTERPPEADAIVHGRG